MLISDIVINARRTLGDTDKQRWTNERMLDIVNSGLKDINKFAGAFRNEVVFEVMDYRTRYPLPLDMQEITSIWYNGVELFVLDRGSRVNHAYVIKDQVNVGVLEVTGLSATKPEGPRFYSGSYASLIEEGDTVLEASPDEGVAVEPVSPVVGVAAAVVISTDLLETSEDSRYGLLTDIMVIGEQKVISDSSVSPYGVLTSIVLPLTPPTDERKGAVDSVEADIRIIGRYGTVASALAKGEYIHIFYKALPTRLKTLEIEFPMSPKFEELMINWIIGTALADDNDASNNTRSDKFMAKYARELTKEHGDAARSYSTAPKSNQTTYMGGIGKG